ncbi:hypothetical protein QQP08_016217 [Theobroma cacao]|nr:hypothetical protein QQP08_016217 [Theobroma cacao]
MNMHIELSYCTRGGFKVSAKNYLNLDPHPLFEKIGDLLKDVNMTPADVYEHLIHGRVERDVNACLESLIQTLETAKEEEEEDAKKTLACFALLLINTTIHVCPSTKLLQLPLLCFRTQQFNLLH